MSLNPVDGRSPWEILPRERRWVIIGAVARVLRRQATVCADDLHDELPTHEYPWDRRAFGAVLLGMVRRGLLESLGYRPSRRGHARAIQVFQEAKA